MAAALARHPAHRTNLELLLARLQASKRGILLAAACEGVIARLTDEGGQLSLLALIAGNPYSKNNEVGKEWREGVSAANEVLGGPAN